MINVSKEFRELIVSDKKHYLLYLDITLSDGTKLSIDRSKIWSNGFSTEDAVSSDNSFDVGSAIINGAKFVLNNIYDEFSQYDFENASVIAHVGLELLDGSIERLRKGTYIVIDPKYNGALISLSCYDNMVLFDRAYSESKLEYPATIKDIIDDACEVCGVALHTVSFENQDYIVENRPSDEAVTFREVISWCAQITGNFARCDAYGQLELKWFNQSVFDSYNVIDGGNFSQWENENTVDGGDFLTWDMENEVNGGTFSELNSYHHIYSTTSISVGTDDVVITGVRVVENGSAEDYSKESVVYFSGAAGYVIEIKNNLLIQNGKGLEVSNYLAEKLIGFRFRKASVTHLSDPSIEAGDVAFLTDRKSNTYPILISSTTFRTGDFQRTTSNAQDVSKNSSQRFSESTKNYVDFRKAIKKEKTEREKALSELESKIGNSSGSYTTVVKTESGGNIYYLHNKPNLSDSDMVWKMTAEAWAVSTDGGKTYNAGMTVDGDTITRILTAVGINADWIKAGKIVVKNKDGKEIFNVDMDFNSVQISGDGLIANTVTADKINVEDLLAIGATIGGWRIDESGITSEIEYDAYTKCVVSIYRPESEQSTDEILKIVNYISTIEDGEAAEEIRDMFVLYADGSAYFDGYVDFNGGYGGTSDERKKNIDEWDERYEEFLLRIPPIFYNQKDDKEHKNQTGIGAQTALSLLNELGLENSALVHGNEKRGYSVNYSQLHAMEIAVIQKQQKEINELRGTISYLLEKLSN